MTLVRIVDPAVIPSAHEYWSMQVAAVLLCLHDQRLLSITPQKLLGSTWEGWSLSEFRGRAPSSAFSDMRWHIQNWGTQYLLADALNSNSVGLWYALVHELQGFVEDISLESATAECYVSGKDSRAGTKFLEV